MSRLVKKHIDSLPERREDLPGSKIAEKNMSIGKDPGNMHYKISMVKSAIRIGGCIWAWASMSIVVLAISLLVAELLGILEEVID
tara:strand:- start:428 stop:682 length:255 start_codon:yes stop_codon:yes gene_type:complete